MPITRPDSRMFTDYTSSCSQDENLTKQNGLKTQEELRMFILNNGLAIQDAQRSSLLGKIVSDDLTPK